MQIAKENCLIIETTFRSLRRLCVLPVGLVTNAICTERAAWWCEALALSGAHFEHLRLSTGKTEDSARGTHGRRSKCTGARATGAPGSEDSKADKQAGRSVDEQADKQAAQRKMLNGLANRQTSW